MIKINDYDGEFLNKYFSEKEAIIINKISSDRSFWSNMFPESFDIHSGAVNRNFVKDILCDKIDQVTKKYKSISYYFDLAELCSINYDEICDSDDTVERKSFRKDILLNRFYDYMVGKLGKSKKNIDEIAKTLKSFDAFKKQQQKKLDKLNARIEKVFNYDLLSPKDKTEIIDNSKIEVCPYCNRNYVKNVDIIEKTKAKKVIRKQLSNLDHFYPKKYFALFSISLYNFVPSCYSCNCAYKSERNYLIPYLYSMKKSSYMSFSLDTDKKELSASQILGWNNDYRICVHPLKACSKEEKKAAKNEIKLFDLEMQYSIHKDFAKDFLYKKNILNKTNFRNILELILKNEKVVITEELIQRLMYGVNFDEEQYLHQPLSKLAHDLNEKY